MRLARSDDPRLLSMLIVLAVAATGSARAGVIERHWNVSSGNYSNPASWSPFGVPDSFDDVIFGELVPSATGAIDGVFTANDVFIRNDTHIVMFDLNASLTAGYLSIEAGSSLYVAGDGDSFIKDVEIFGHMFLGGSVFLSGGAVAANVVNDTLDGTGLVEGHGFLAASSGGQFTGTVRAEDGTLTFGGANFDLDGTTDENTILNAVPGGELRIVGSLTDPFSGTIDIAPGGRVEFTLGDVDVFVPLVGSGTDAAELEVDRLIFPGVVRAMGGLSRFEGHLEDGATLLVDPGAVTDATIVNDPFCEVEVNGTLRFDGVNELWGGQVFGVGTIDANPGSLLRVEEDSSLSMPSGVIELDDVFVLGGKSLTIWSTKLTTGDPATDGYEGAFENWGSVNVMTPDPWRMGGVFEFDGTLSTPELHGSMMVVTDGGLVRAAGVGGIVTAPFQLLDGATLEFATELAVLELNGSTFYSGGDVTGVGTLVQGGDAIVNGTTVISPTKYDWDGTGAGSTLVVSTDGHLTVDTELLDPRNTSLRVRGILDVTNRTSGGDPAPWLMAGPLIAHAASSIHGTEVILDSGGVLDLDSGNALEVGFFAPLRIEDGGQVQTDPAATLYLHGPTTLNGQNGPPLIVGDGDVVQNGDLLVESNSEIECDRYEWDGFGDDSTVTTIQPGATLTVDVEQFGIFFDEAFNGTIDVASGAGLTVLITDADWVMAGTMTLDADSFVSGTDLFNAGRIEGETTMQTDLKNSGTLAPTGTFGFNVFTFFEQTANGTLEIAIGGAVPGVDYGRIQMNQTFSSATLDGRLAVTLENGYVPAIGATFDVIIASDVFGVFDEIDAPGFDVSYPTNRVRLTFTGLPCDGDVTGDGSVGFGDLLDVLAAWGPCPPPCTADINEDGVVDFADLLLVLAGWGVCP